MQGLRGEERSRVKLCCGGQSIYTFSGATHVILFGLSRDLILDAKDKTRIVSRFAFYMRRLWLLSVLSVHHLTYGSTYDTSKYNLSHVSYRRIHSWFWHVTMTRRVMSSFSSNNSDKRKITRYGISENPRLDLRQRTPGKARQRQIWTYPGKSAT